jgi:hypothetical protein
MSSRALIPATVLFLIGAFAPGRSLAQENLDAGKTPAQLFAGTCNACHRSPRGLLKTVSPSSLQGFLRQHYTTSPNMAGVLASYLVSNGAADTRVGESPRGARGAKEGTRENTRQEARQRPETEAAPQANAEHGADARKGGAKQRLSKRGRPEEPATPSIEPPKPEPPKPDSKDETASREEGNKPESSKPADEGGSQSAKVEQPAETSTIRPDPVPPVTPAPPSAAEPAKPEATSEPTPSPGPSSPPSPAQASITPAGTEMAVPLPPSPVAPPAPPPAATASAPPLPPVPPAGPPAPPISQ